MFDVSLKDFILTGNWGSIRLGLARTEVINLIGEPEDWLSNAKNYSESVIWSYGNIEFYFDSSDKLEMIFTDYLENINGCQTFNMDSWFLSKSKQKNKKNLQLKTIRKILNKNKIRFKLNKVNTDKIEQYEMLFNSGVKIMFHKTDLNDNLIQVNDDKVFFASSLYIHS